MKLIAHRGNTDGPNPLEENRPEYIEDAIDRGFDVEIDIRYSSVDQVFYLGHDDSQYFVGWYWLSKHSEKLWIHCKNLAALYEFNVNTSAFNYFWHQTDYFTLTSKNYIWTYPGQSYTSQSVIVMPEFSYNVLKSLKAYCCHGICSDYVGELT
jgi:glycerophosphoryl diester phosphodiesterase